MDAEEYAAREAELSEKLKAAREAHKATGAQVDKLWQQHVGLLEKRLLAMPDDEILADEEKLRWLLRHATYNSKAYDRSRALEDPGCKGLYLTGCDARDEYYGQGLPVLTLTLTSGQSVAELAPVIRQWHKRWALGREVIPIDILEHTASEFGSWCAWYRPAANEAWVIKKVYSRDEEKFRGPLIGMLDYVAREAWLHRPGEEW